MVLINSEDQLVPSYSRYLPYTSQAFGTHRFVLNQSTYVPFFRNRSASELSDIRTFRKTPTFLATISTTLPFSNTSHSSRLRREQKTNLEPTILSVLYKIPTCDQWVAATASFLSDGRRGKLFPAHRSARKSDTANLLHSSSPQKLGVNFECNSQKQSETSHIPLVCPGSLEPDRDPHYGRDSTARRK